MNTPTVVVLVIVVIVVALAAAAMIVRRKKGYPACGSHCKNCPRRSDCTRDNQFPPEVKD